jgi:hypothetical protein
MRERDACLCLHVDEAGHDNRVSVIEERAAEHEVAEIPDGDGVDQPRFDLH